MDQPIRPIPSWQLYGEDSPFPDLLHVERIIDRAKGHGWQIGPHRHVQLHQIFLLQSGQIALVVDGQPWSAPAPFALNMPRLAVHEFRFSAGTEGWVLTMAAADFPEVFGPASPVAAHLARPFLARDVSALAQAFSLLEYRHGTADPLRRLDLRRSALDICADLVRSSGTLSTQIAAQDPRMARFDALIRDHLADGWALADYAGTLGLSERHLRRLCLDATGQSTHDFIETIRLREACRLLAYTRWQVQEVGFALGFDDPAYFSRVFQRRMGLSPGAYRTKLDG